MAIHRKTFKLFRFIVLCSLGLLLFAANFKLLWNYSGIRHKVRIEGDSHSPLFQVVVIDSGRAELFLMKEEMDGYLKEHPDYSFLIPANQEQIVQEQVVAAYKKRYTGKGFPILKVQPLNAGHQLIELYMNGDPHDDVFWYEASEKNIVPQYYMIFGVFHLALMTGLSIVLVGLEYQGVLLLIKLARKRRART